MIADRPYVDRPVPDRVAADRVAAEQAAEWQLPAPRLLRHGMNSLYLAGATVIRVGAATAPAETSHRLAHWLIGHGIPTIEPSDGCCADVDGLAVSGWQFVPESRRAVDWEAVGAAVRAVHSLPIVDVPDGYPVPWASSFGWWQFDDMLADVAGEIDAAAFDGLSAAIERNRGWDSRIRTDPVLCHGDVHPGNVLMSGRGAMLVDWDLLCVADPAWDHGMISVYADRWGGDPAAYARFAVGYGSPPVDPGLTACLGELRNVAATIMRVKAGRMDDVAAAEAERRLRYWRGDPDAPVWVAQ